MYDFDTDGLISQDDVRMLLSHIPLVKKASREYYELFEINQTEIKDMIKECFQIKSKLNLEDFTSISLQNSSDMFFAVYYLSGFSIY